MPAQSFRQPFVDQRGSGAVTLRARDMIPGGYGSYRFAAETGTMAAAMAADGEIFEFRYDPTDTNMRAVLRRLTLSVIALGTGFTAGQCIFEAKVARAFTVAGTGGASVVLTTNQAKLRSSYGTSLAEARISTTAAMTAGTQTLDTRAFSSIMRGVSTSAFENILSPTDLYYSRPGEQEIVLAGDEGIVILATVPATGTWAATVTCEWDEVQLTNV